MIKVEMSWMKVDIAGGRWEHDLVIPIIFPSMIPTMEVEYFTSIFLNISCFQNKIDLFYKVGKDIYC